MNRRRLALAILLILLPLALVWGYLTYPRQRTAATLKYAPGSHAQAERRRQPAARTAVPTRTDNVLRLDLLAREEPIFKGYRRNIFKPVFMDEHKPLKPRAVAPMPAPPVVQKAPVQPIAVPEPPRRELAHFTFLGFLKKGNRKTIFLAKDKDIILVRAGDVIAGRYKAVSVTDQDLSLLVSDTGEQIVIPLMENRPLGAVR